MSNEENVDNVIPFNIPCFYPQFEHLNNTVLDCLEPKRHFLWRNLNIILLNTNWVVLGKCYHLHTYTKSPKNNVVSLYY